MATQTIQFRSPPSQTVTLRLFVAGSDTQIASASATEATNRKGTYTAAFTDVPAAEYQYVATIGSSPIIPVASGYVTLTLTTATFQVYDAAKAVNLSEVIVSVDGDAIADSVWSKAIAGFITEGTFGYVVAAISTMIENVSGWRFVAKAVELVTDRLPDVLVGGRIKSVISDAQVESIADAVAAALLQLDPAYVLVRSTADDKDLTFSWPNSTDTVAGQVSIDNGDYVDVAGDIEYFRQDNGVHFYTLSYAAPDRPSEEGTARYKFTSVSHTMMATLRLDANAGGGTATIGDWAITRTFQVSGGDKVSGARMSLVGVDGKSVTTGSSGIAVLQADNGTYTLRVAVPAGYDPVADSSVTIADGDSTATVTLVSTVVAPAPSGQCNVSLPVTDGAGTGQVGATVKITFLRFAPGATPTATVIPPVPVQTSIAPGVVSVQLLRLGTYRATYSYGTGTKDFEFIVPDAATYEVVERV